MWTESGMGRHRTRESPRPEQAKKPDPSRGGGEPRGRGADGREGLAKPRTRKEKQPRRATSGGPGLDHSPHAQGSAATPVGGRSQGRGSPKFAIKSPTPASISEGPRANARARALPRSLACLVPLAPFVPQPLLQPGLLLPRAGGAWRRRRRVSQLEVIPDNDARGRARVAAPRRVSEERRVETQKA